MKPRLAITLLGAALVVWLFAPVLSGRASFGFRDAAHYYHPLFEYIRDEWRAGRPPWWNPYENLGSPLVAENTSSVFYPAKLLFFLPLDYTWLYNAYIVGHVVLAAATSYLLARRFASSVLAAGLAALAYAFSGSVLFLYSNVVFLVGASWLPLALLFVDRMLGERTWGPAVALGTVLALMVLGGDPQMAYNAALLAALYALLLWREERHTSSASRTATRPAWYRWRPTLLVASLATAGCLAAVQVLPTLEASPHSERARYDAPRNVYELAHDLVSPGESGGDFSWYEGLLDSNHKGHHERVYRFSLAPSGLAELVWPGVTGHAFPTDNRWLRGLGLERLLWLPSVYLGLAPLVLALCAWNVTRAAPVATRFWSWTALAGTLGSMGAYGIGWIVRQSLSGEPVLGLGDETGSLYWWMVVALPNYVQFRYPAKLFVIASLALAVLAAKGWDRFWQEGDGRVYAWLAALPVVSLSLLAVLAVKWKEIEGQPSEWPATRWLGPFNWQGAWNNASDGLLHGTLLALALLACFWLGRRMTRYAGLMQLVALLVTVVDLALAQEHLILYAPADSWSFTPPVVETLRAKLGTARVFRQLGPVPESWEYRTSPTRYQDWVLWDRQTLWPKYPLPYSIPLAEAAQTVVGNDYHILLEVAVTRNRREHHVAIPYPGVLDLAAARYAIVAGGALTQVENPRPIAEDMYLGERPTAMPRAWIVHEVELVPPLVTRSPTRIRDWTEELAFPNHEPRDWRRTAVVESSVWLDDEWSTPPEGSEDSCRIVRDEPGHVEIEATLAAGGLVVLADQFYPGWELTVSGEDGSRERPILRTNHVMRGVLLPAGRYVLTYRYRPLSIFAGAVISGVSLGALILFATGYWWRRAPTK